MTDQLEKISAQIMQEFAAGKLVIPSLPEVINRIQQAVSDKKRGTQQIAKLIQLDPALTARLIQIANSATYGGSFPIDTCQMAITRLGLRTTRNLVTCLVMHNVFDASKKSVHKRIRELWKHSCRVAAIASVLAQINKGLIDPDKSLLAGLIHDIGVLPVLYFLADYPELCEQNDFVDALISKLRGRLGREILKAWQFEEALIAVAEEAENWHYQGEERLNYVDIVIVAQIHSSFGTPMQMELPELSELPAFAKMSLSRLGPEAGIELLHAADSEIREMVRMLLG